MNSIIRFSIYCLVILLCFNIKVYSINYGKYFNIYNVPYYEVDQSFKNLFYEDVHKQDYIRNKIKYKNSERSETFVPYKTKLDNIVKYI